MNQYEAMFLFDPTFGTSFENCEKEIRRLLERAEAEILICRQWDERRLAYKVKGRKRGVYVLVYFKARPEKISPLMREARLSENILRLLVLRAEGLTIEAMERSFTYQASDRPADEARGGPRGRRPRARADESEAPQDIEEDIELAEA